MKRAVAILVFISLLTQCLAHLAVVGFYELNKDYIARNLCENRNKPEKKCCGKCVLRKQLKKVDAPEDAAKNQQTTKVDKTEVLYLVTQYTALSLKYIPAVSAVLNPSERRLHHILLPVSIFHPPLVAC